MGNFEFSGELSEGDEDLINIIAENNELAEGIYNAYLSISSNAGDPESFLIELITSGSSLTGDLNDDDVQNVLDIIILVNIILGENEQNPAGDVNNDGVINILDVVSLVNIILEG